MNDDQQKIDQPDGDAEPHSEESTAPLESDPVEPEPSRVAYRRVEPADTLTEPVSRARSIWTRELSPAIIPLIVGFTLLLILVGVLGFLSVTRMDEVGRAVLDLEQQ